VFGEYLSANFEAQGFIHCAYSNQFRSVIEAKFRGEDDLALLEIDSSRLECSVKVGDGGFSHIQACSRWKRSRPFVKSLFL
jgi:uncharacterized protein (DUF952 family)